jgi:hypothetical protein
VAGHGAAEARRRRVLRAAAPTILPHLRDRPFTIKRHYNLWAPVRAGEQRLAEALARLTS